MNHKFKITLLSTITMVSVAGGLTVLANTNTPDEHATKHAAKALVSSHKSEKKAAVKIKAKAKTSSSSASSSQSQPQPQQDTSDQNVTNQSEVQDSTPAPAPQPVAESNDTPASNAPAAATPADPAPSRTDGFNLNGAHFDLADYSDMSGAEVPQWTPYVYRYVVLPNYYLAEGQSQAGITALNAGIGSTLTLNGRVLHMTGVISVNRTDPNAFEQMRAVGSQNQAVLQTCYDATGNNLKVALFN